MAADTDTGARAINPQEWNDWNAEDLDAMEAAARRWASDDTATLMGWVRMQIVGLLHRCVRLQKDLQIAEDNVRYYRDGERVKFVEKMWRKAEAKRQEWERRARAAEAKLSGLTDGDLAGVRFRREQDR